MPFFLTSYFKLEGKRGKKMLNKMYVIMDAACQWGNKNMRTSIQFPKPTKKSMIFSAFSSAIISSVIVIYGFFFSSIWMLFVGGLGIISSVFIYLHSVKMIK